MDLESENSALESVEDNNGLIAEAETMGDKLVSGSIPVEDETSIKPLLNSAPVAKGFGLRKWRRVKREIVRDTCVNLENSKILKRILSGATDPNAKQSHFSGLDVRQDSLGSVGSVNNNNDNMVRLEAGLAFSAGGDSDNSEDRSSKSSTAASGPKVRNERKGGKYFGGISTGEERKSRVENSKKSRGERIKIEKENSHSSMESADSRGSNFVFMQGASSSLEQGGRRMMDYNEDNSDHDAHTSSNQKDNVGEEEEGAEDYSREDSVDESQSKNNGLDPLTEAFNSFQNLEEILKKELQKFQELGKETISSSLDNGVESSSCIHTGYEGGSEASSSRLFGSKRAGSTSLDSEILNLVKNVEHLEIKLEEAKSIIEVKEVQIRELESNIKVSEPQNQGTEIGIEKIFQQKMEAEIEYIVFSRSVSSLNRQIKVIEEEKTLAENEANWTLSKLGEAETKAENLKNQAQGLQNHCVEITKNQEVKSFKKRVTKTTSCLLLQLGILALLFLQLMPESENVVPT